MKSVSRFIVKLADLAEAEGRTLRRETIGVGLAVSIAVGAALIGVIGVVMLGWALFVALRPFIGVSGAAAVCGLALLACAGGLVWLVKRLGH